MPIEGTDSNEDENTAEFSTFLEDLSCDEYNKPNHPNDISGIPPLKNQESKCLLSILVVSGFSLASLRTKIEGSGMLCLFNGWSTKIIGACGEIDLAFISIGLRNWKKRPQRFRDNNNSKIHRITTYKINSLYNPSIRAQVDSQLIQQQKIARKSLLKLFTSERYLLRQGMAFRWHSADDGNYQQLSKLRAEDDSNFSFSV